MRIGPLAAAFLAACAAPLPREPEEWDRELPVEVDLDGHSGTHLPIRVVDDATGEPIPGARIDNWWESSTPMPGEWEELIEQSVVTDRDGWAVVRREGAAPWWFVEAPGRGPVGEMGLMDEFRLRPGVDATVEVRDFLDRPVPGTAVEVLLGCGHTPFVRCEVSDAAGRLLLRSVDMKASRLWVRAEGLAGRSRGYEKDLGDLEEEGGVRILRCLPGPVVEGIVRDARGAPVAGAAVGTLDSHRGPWTRTGPDGRFRLLGAPARDRLTALLDEEDLTESSWRRAEFDTAPGVFLTVRLPDDEEEEEREGAGEDGRPVADEGHTAGGLRLHLWTSAQPAPWVKEEVVCVREVDGEVAKSSVEWRDGRAVGSVDLGPGTWRVTAGSATGRFRRETAKATVGNGASEVSLHLTENPRWLPRVLRAGSPTPAPWPGRFWIVTAEERAEAESVPEGEGAIFLPAAGPFVVEYEEGDAEARVRLDAPPAGEGPALVLPPLPPGDPDAPCEPTPGADFPEAEVRVLLPDGSPASRAQYTAEWRSGRGRSTWFNGRLGEDGRDRRAFSRGERITVTLDEDDLLVPLEATVGGPEPVDLRWPAGEVEVRALDEDGVSLPEATVVLGDRDWDAAGGALRLRGLPAGPVRLWVSAEGRRAHDIRIVLREGERRTVEVRLRP